jgi:uncharacterized OB-fold protein
VVSYLVLDDPPYLRANECTKCGASFLDARIACPSCATDAFQPRRLASTGVIRAFTVVHRGPPGVVVPFIAAVVDLDGGGTVKANIVDTDPAAVSAGLPVEFVTFPLGVDSQGTEAVGFGYRPLSGRENSRG